MRPRTLTRIKTGAVIAACILTFANFAAAQLPPPTPAPPSALDSLSPPSSDTGEPARDIPLVEKPWAELSNQEVGPEGQLALSIKPGDWKHAETDNFIIHFRRVTEARKVAREIEYDLWFVAKTLGATPAQYRRKSHVFVFKDEAEWNAFLEKTHEPLWFASFASRDELFLNIRSTTGGEPFDSHTLAHETTHAVVVRLYPFEHWPVWLNEGFAEFMGGASVAARNHQLLKNYQHDLNDADMPLEELFALKTYPQDREKVDQLYETGEKFVRFLMNELPKERFRKYVTELLSTKDPKQSLLTVYGDKIKDFDTFQKKFEAFSK